MNRLLPLLLLFGLTAAVMQDVTGQDELPRPANLDESKIPPYTEPNPLQSKDGRILSSVQAWERTQRAYIYDLFAKNVYGRMPVRGVPVTYTTGAVDSGAVDGLAIRKEITISFNGDTAVPLKMILYLPKSKQPAAVFIGYSFNGNTSVKESSQWPLKTILSRGYGIVSAWYQDLEADRKDGWKTGIRTRLAMALDIRPEEWSAIGAWAWGLERMADYLQTDKAIDSKRLIIFGHSRLGKATLWAAANDPRFAMVISNESGEGGAALSKRDYGENISIITHNFPYWFVPAYRQYGADPAGTLPLDQHMLLALMAPRPLYVASAIGDQWSDPKGEFLSAQMASPVYALYKKKGIDPTEPFPPVESPVGDFVRYHIRNGKHDITPYDWGQYLDFADRRLK